MNIAQQITLTKHSGLGNDFLVLDMTQLDGVSARALVTDEMWARYAREWCDSRSGVGADGLLLLGGTVGSDRLTLRLFNSDGSQAEMSGNGIRCLAQAAFMRDGRSDACTYVVRTAAGDRSVEVVAHDLTDDTLMASVDMGAIEKLSEPANWSTIGCDPNRPVAHISVGNPHAVVGVEDVRAVNLLEIGLKVPQINLEIIEPGPESHAITMRVHERGAGITQACGTGACASAWAAVQWGLVASSVAEVLVHMDGGDASVRVNSPAPGRVTLVGPAQYIGTMTVEMRS
jgi:diaminopimelate epimerase